MPQAVKGTHTARPAFFRRLVSALRRNDGSDKNIAANYQIRVLHMLKPGLHRYHWTTEVRGHVIRDVRAIA